jgi:hypothetical protein
VSFGGRVILVVKYSCGGKRFVLVTRVPGGPRRVEKAHGKVLCSPSLQKDTNVNDLRLDCPCWLIMIQNQMGIEY